MRFGVVVLIALSSAACAQFQKPVAQASAPAAASEKPAAVADVAPAKFECSDGTVSNSQEACLVNMARARLPPGQMIERAPSGSAAADQPTGSVR
jgi:hypothetical protein